MRTISVWSGLVWNYGGVKWHTYFAHAQCESPEKMANNYHGGSQSPTSISKPIERVFEDAQHTGEISLSCRKLREYPKLAAKYDLIDTISAGQHLLLFFSPASAMIHQRYSKKYRDNVAVFLCFFIILIILLYFLLFLSYMSNISPGFMCYLDI